MTTTTAKRPPDALKGRRVYFYRDRDGFRSGKVLRVDAGKRVGLKAVTVLTHDGRRLRVDRRDLERPNHPVGLLWRGRTVPVREWLAGAVRVLLAAAALALVAGCETTSTVPVSDEEAARIMSRSEVRYLHRTDAAGNPITIQTGGPR